MRRATHSLPHTMPRPSLSASARRRAAVAAERHASTSAPTHSLVLAPARPRAPPASFYAAHGQRRTFFGLGEIIGVLTNPAETVRSLTESRRLLEEARTEISESRERAQLRPAHTFSRCVPGVRPAWVRAC
jgi:hypothetical protein